MSNFMPTLARGSSPSVRTGAGHSLKWPPLKNSYSSPPAQCTRDGQQSLQPALHMLTEGHRGFMVAWMKFFPEVWWHEKAVMGCSGLGRHRRSGGCQAALASGRRVAAAACRRLPAPQHISAAWRLAAWATRRAPLARHLAPYVWLCLFLLAVEHVRICNSATRSLVQAPSLCIATFGAGRGLKHCLQQSFHYFSLFSLICVRKKARVLSQAQAKNDKANNCFAVGGPLPRRVECSVAVLLQLELDLCKGDQSEVCSTLVDSCGKIWVRSFLLHTGCCETTLARAVAGTVQSTFTYLSCAQLHSMYVGEGEAALQAAFLTARASAPAVLFIDEVDSIAGGDITDISTEQLSHSIRTSSCFMPI